MARLILALQRALALYAVRSLETELHGQTMALHHVNDIATYRAISIASEHTRRALLKARQRYIDRLDPGHCPTWETA